MLLYTSTIIALVWVCAVPSDALGSIGQKWDKFHHCNSRLNIQPVNTRQSSLIGVRFLLLREHEMPPGYLDVADAIGFVCYSDRNPQIQSSSSALRWVGNINDTVKPECAALSGQDRNTLLRFVRFGLLSENFIFLSEFIAATGINAVDVGASGWRFSNILNINRKFNPHRSVSAIEAKRIDPDTGQNRFVNFQLRPLLVAHDLVSSVCSGDSIPLSLKSSPNKIEATPSKNRTSDTRKSHSLGPQSHRHLRIKIALSTAMILSGFYFIMYAFNEGRSISLNAGLINTIFGVLNVMLGILLAAHSFFSL